MTESGAATGRDRRAEVRVEVSTRHDRFDAEGARLTDEARRLLGSRAPADLELRTLQGYSLLLERAPGEAEDAALETALHRVLVDPVLHEHRRLGHDDPPPAPPPGWRRLDVARKPGVMDPVADSVRRAFAALGVALHSVRTYRSCLVQGALDDAQLRRLGSQLLANEIIEDLHLDPTDPVHPLSDGSSTPFQRVEVELDGLDDEALLQLSREGMLALDLREMRCIQSHFRELGRKPSDVELETLAQTWSEHCKHKTLTSTVVLADRRYDNLLKDTIFEATRQLNDPHCLSVFADNAGAVSFDDDYAVTFKVETHNHPSALEPYGGAGTGIGGVIRDTLGTGLGARPVLSTDVFCVGPLDLGPDQLPPGTHPPRRILQGVVAGVRDYGNRMGIPTPNGAVFVHEDYRANPLVFAGNVGLIPRGMLSKAARPGDRVFVLGGRTGRDGIHGATFSSIELDTDSEETSGGAVQIGNPIEEKRVLDACMDARDRGLFTAVTDCGAGGLSSAIGEMGEDCGADVELSDVPLKYEGLSAGEIWISEAQERMVAAVPPEKAEELLEVCRLHQVEATDLGHFSDTGRLVVRYQGEAVVDLSMEFLHDGVPRPTREAVDPPAPAPAQAPPTLDDPGATLLALLRHPNITSKEQIVRQYDHEVLAGSAIKPMVGVAGDGPSDGCVVAPRLGSRRGVAVGCGLSPTTGRLDPYRMAMLAIDEAVRNVVSVGGRFDRIALLDNFAWPKVDDARSLGEVVRACEACRDASLSWRLPFISGKDSLNNQLMTDAGPIRIPPTLLISAMTVMDDVTGAVSMDLKAEGHALILVGATRSELGGSHWLLLHDRSDGAPPEVPLERAREVHHRVSGALASGAVRSCHDLSEGGLAVAVAEMCHAGGIGARVDLDAVVVEGEGCDETGVRLFAETPTRYLLAVEPDKVEMMKAALADLPHAVIGETGGQRLVLTRGEQTALELPLHDLAEAYRTGLGL